MASLDDFLTASAARHPSVLRFHAEFYCDGLFYLADEFADGCALGAHALSGGNFLYVRCAFFVCVDCNFVS